uniref:Vegetative cell wall protein gp1-like n=1 Tax=Saccoglossus kowalevskii TaxID=10224 RepID=A0ABM0MA07_SACKO|nr:PREDICTED: vegetative cell wall protein gp1-like [Saccoglossus kowalevskii]
MMVDKNQRYRFSLVVNEIKNIELTAYKTTLMAFINSLIIATDDIIERRRLRNEFIGLGLLDIIASLRHEDDTDLCIQLDVFDEHQTDDEDDDEIGHGMDINSHFDVFHAVFTMVSDSPHGMTLLSILQCMLQLEPDNPLSDVIWGTMELFLRRAVVMENKSQVEKLLNLNGEQIITANYQTKSPCSRMYENDLQTIKSDDFVPARQPYVKVGQQEQLNQNYVIESESLQSTLPPSLTKSFPQVSPSLQSHSLPLSDQCSSPSHHELPGQSVPPQLSPSSPGQSVPPPLPLLPGQSVPAPSPPPPLLPGQSLPSPSPPPPSLSGQFVSPPTPPLSLPGQSPPPLLPSQSPPPLMPGQSLPSLLSGESPPPSSPPPSLQGQSVPPPSPPSHSLPSQSPPPSTSPSLPGQSVPPHFPPTPSIPSQSSPPTLPGKSVLPPSPPPPLLLIQYPPPSLPCQSPLALPPQSLPGKTPPSSPPPLLPGKSLPPTLPGQSPPPSQPASLPGESLPYSMPSQSVPPPSSPPPSLPGQSLPSSLPGQSLPPPYLPSSLPDESSPPSLPGQSRLSSPPPLLPGESLPLSLPDQSSPLLHCKVNLHLLHCKVNLHCFIAT